MSGAIDLISLQLLRPPSRGGWDSASTLRGAGSASLPSHRAAVSAFLIFPPSVFLIRQPSETGSLSPIALTFSPFVSFSPDYQCH